MASAYDKLKRILTLERDQGCRDRVVIGGLARFLAYWEKDARAEAEHAAPKVTVDSILAALADYARMLPDARQDVLGRLLDQMLGDGTLPSVLVALPQPIPLPGPAPKAGPGKTRETSPREAMAAPPARVAHPAKSPSVGPQMTLNSSVVVLKGVSTVHEERLARLGISTVRDLLYHFPRRYDNFADLRTISRLALDDEVTVVGVVQDVKVQRTRTGQVILKVVVSDGTGAIEARWFAQPFLEKHFRVGNEIVLSGRIAEHLGRLVFSGPEWEPLQRELLHTARLVPVYPLTEGVGARWLRRVIKNTLDYWCPRLVDPVPHSVLESQSLIDLGTALAQMHFPDSDAALERARQRLCFDEFLLLQLGILHQRQVRRAQPGRALTIPQPELEGFVAGLPFKLTSAQQRAVAGILADLQRPVPMTRLLQGDVGSGKTVVAVAAILATVRNGLQAAIMVPTSILAEQHYLTISRMLERFPDVRCELLVGRLSAAEKRRLHDEIAAGCIQVVIGTHALIQSSVQFDAPGLIVVDEQHRFGVEQRAALRAKGTDFEPHLLAMSATPIPRTLALTVYGDMDISVLDELPPNRQRIITVVRDPSSRERVYAFLDAQVRQERQAFIICPLVEESDKTDAKAAVAEHQRLQKDIFPHLKLGLLHGRMSADDKEQTMAAFKAGAYHILVSTAVVEVGIDVPNATVILIEGAERFGLAQLHQFRGRVGRGESKSYCILLSEDASEESLKRLQVMEETHDGFILAEKDLELRGPGDFFGVRQHGLPMLKVAQLSDTTILGKARTEALKLFAADPELVQAEHQLLAASVHRFWSTEELS